MAEFYYHGVCFSYEAKAKPYNRAIEQMNQLYHFIKCESGAETQKILLTDRQ